MSSLTPTYQLEQVGITHGRVRPQYSLFPRFATIGPDLVAYQRFRRASEIPSAFVPPSGSAWLRVRLTDLHLIALAALLEPNAVLSTVNSRNRQVGLLDDRIRQILAVSGSPVHNTEQAAFLITLVASGTSPETTEVVVDWLGQVAVTNQQVDQIIATVKSAWPELCCHLADRTLDQFAAALLIDPDELNSLIGQPTIGGPAAAFFHRFVGSGLSKEIRLWVGIEEKKAVAEMRKRRFAVGYQPVSMSHLAAALGECGPKLTERVVTATGRVFAKRSWIEARSAYLTLAEDALLAAAFAVVAAGHRVVAITPDELLAEVPETPDLDDDVKTITTCVQDAIASVLGGRSSRPEVEQIERW